MSNKFKQYLTTLYYLLKRDLQVFRTMFWGKFIDSCIFLFTIVFTFEYFLPQYGLTGAYGSFIVSGVIVGYGFYEIIGKVTGLIWDIEGPQTITYPLMLPVTSGFIFFYTGLSYAVFSSIFGLILFPLGKIALGSEFDLSIINYFQLIPIFILSNIFFGYFALWIGSVAKKSTSGDLFARVVNPLYSLGGYFYAWKSMYNISPIAGYINLLNPLIYVMEGMRAAMLGPEGFLPFWFSFMMLLLFTTFFAWDAIRRLKKRLDCV